MADPSWLIPPPSGGSSECFTSPTRGSAETAFRLDSESQEDREGPQLTSSEGVSRGNSVPPRALSLRVRGALRLVQPWRDPPGEPPADGAAMATSTGRT